MDRQLRQPKLQVRSFAGCDLAKTWKMSSTNKSALVSSWTQEKEAAILSRCGYSNWKQRYLDKRPPVDTLLAEIDTEMQEYDAKILEAFEAQKAKHNVADDEGWITVTRAGKRNTNSDGKVTIVAASKTDLMQTAIEKKKKQKTFPNFYSFQQREEKLDKLAELRSNFEKDKKKIAAMKASRKFKPY